MKLSAGFWFGMGAGLVAGAAAGMMTPCGKDSMKTQVGRSIHKLGVAVDHAVDVPHPRKTDRVSQIK